MIRCLRLAIAAIVVVVAGVATTTTAAALAWTYDSAPPSRVGVHTIESASITCPLIVGSPTEPALGSLAASGTSAVLGASTTPLVVVNATNTADDALRSVDDVMGGLSPGRQPHVRTVSSPGELQTVYDDLASGGVPAEWSGYKGTVVRRPDGVEVGIRGSSDSGGATIDIRLPDGATQKVHIAG